MAWNGRYFSTLLLSINPLVYKCFWGYKIIPIILLIIFYSGLYFFLKNIFTNLSKVAVHIMGLLLVVTYLNIVPSLSETIYWMSSSLTYFLAWGLTLYLLGFLIRYYNQPHKKRLNAAFSILLIICIIGSNELSAFLVLFIIIGIIIYELYQNKKINKFSLQFLIISLFFVLVVILAPGNKGRLSLFGNHYNMAFSIINTIEKTLVLIFLHLTNPPFIIISILVFINAPTLISGSIFLNKILKINTIILFVIPLLIIIFFYFTSAFNTGISPPLRIYAFISLFFFFTAFLIILQIRDKYVVFDLPFISLQKLNFILVAAFLLFIGSDFSKVPGKHYLIKGNILQSFNDLRSDAYNYNKDLDDRYLIIEQEIKKGNMNIKVPSLTVKPRSIFFVDIKPDSSNWINIGYAQYFNISSIKTTE